MKRVVSVILAIISISLCSIVPVYANDVYYDNLFGFLYVDEYLKQYEPYAGIMYYTEEYYHKTIEDENTENIDWALVSAYSFKDDFSDDLSYYAVIEDRVLIKRYYTDPFLMEYAVYDVAKNSFIEISDVNVNNYSGLMECLEALRIGLPIGDVHADGKLTVLDATEIQRVMAQLSEFHENDTIKAEALSKEELKYISDFNRDGVRSILDATAIQRKLAKLD